MVRANFDRDLTALQEELIGMGNLVENAISTAMEGLVGRNADTARGVVAGDAEIDRIRVSLEERCIDLMATQQPNSIDLRTLVASLHISAELERIGDYAKGIARISLAMGDEPPLKPLVDLPLMATKSTDMMNRSLQALTDRDDSAARQVCNDDDEVDDLYDQVYQELLTYMLQDPRSIRRATYLLWIAHELERIADRATNISERAIFLVTGNPVDTQSGQY